MKSIGNLGGILYYRDVPLIKFKFKAGMLIDAEYINEIKRYLPVEIQFNGLEEGLVEFLIDRPTPDTRIGIHEHLKETPIQYYNVERMLRYCHAQSIHDCFWVKQDEDNKCWDGSPLEGIGIKPANRWNELISSKRFE